MQLLLSEPQIFSSVKNSNACLKGLLSVSQELIFRKFLSECLVHTINIMLLLAAKLLQSCPTLCDPIDGSPPGSLIPGILQARTPEWVAISFSNAWKWKVKVKSCLTVSDLMDCSPPGSSIHGILKARVGPPIIVFLWKGKHSLLFQQVFSRKVV